MYMNVLVSLLIVLLCKSEQKCVGNYPILTVYGLTFRTDVQLIICIFWPGIS